VSYCLGRFVLGTGIAFWRATRRGALMAVSGFWPREVQEREKVWGSSLIRPNSIWDIRVTAGDEIRVKETDGAWKGCF